MQNTPTDQSAQERVYATGRKPVVQTKRARERRAKVAKLLGGEFTYRQIGEMLGVSGEVIRNDVIVLGMTKLPPKNTRGVPVPRKPRGFTAEQKAWAKANPTNPEARMILAMVKG